MEKFFDPSSIAVYGVSSKPGNLAAFIIENLQEMAYQGRIYGVGPQECTIKGCEVYTALKEIPGQIDLVTVVTPAHTVPGIFRECGNLGIDRVVVITAGFNELGGEGLRLSQEILEIADRYRIKFIGPNCQGLIDFHTGVCLPFGLLRRHQINKGRIAIISQSGSVGWLTSLILSHEIDGLSKVISIGNKLSVDEIQLTEYLMEDDQTEVILYYLESLTDGRRLCEFAMRSKKPFVILKANRGTESQLALSHTGALASDDRVVEAAFNQAGIIRAETFRELLEWAKALSGIPMQGPNIVSMASSGGMAIMCEDACRKLGLNLIDLPRDVKERLWDIGRPKIINYTNPIDLGNVFDNKNILQVLKIVLALDGVDAVVFSIFNLVKEIHGELQTKDIIHLAYEEANRANKPIAISLVTDPESVYKFKQETIFPIYDTIEDAVESLRKKLQYSMLKSRTKRSMSYEATYRDIDRAVGIISSTTDYYLDDIDAMELLECYGITSIKPRAVKSREQIRETAQEIGYPVVMKINSRQIPHKSDVGGVRLGIKHDADAYQCYDEMIKAVKISCSKAQILGVKLQRMVHEGIEVIVGGKKDKDFGPVIMVGLGGIYTEIIDDVVFHLAPLSKAECLEMLKELKGCHMFAGLRGKNPFDLDALANILVRFSTLLIDFPQISEADLNPVRVFENGSGASVLDARIFLEKENGSETRFPPY